MMKYREVELKMDLAQCLQCRKILHRGEKIIQGCGARLCRFIYQRILRLCLADYKEARESVGERAKRRLSVQFN